MTPDEVVASARELEGKEVLVTVRGVVMFDGEADWSIGTPRIGRTQAENTYRILTIEGVPRPDLVDIQLAPIRIVAGEMYRDAAGGLIFEGDDHGMLLRPGVDDTFSPASFPGLQRVKVVPT